jgi:hypothetical protein
MPTISAAIVRTRQYVAFGGLSPAVLNGFEPLTRIGVEELTTLQAVRPERQAWKRAAQRSAGRLGAQACRWWAVMEANRQHPSVVAGTILDRHTHFAPLLRSVMIASSRAKFTGLT